MCQIQVDSSCQIPSCREKTLFKKKQIDKIHIDIKRKNKEEMERFNDNVMMIVHSYPEILKKIVNS